MLLKRVTTDVEVDLSEFPISDIISYIKNENEWPKDKKIDDFSDSEIEQAFIKRGLKVKPDNDDQVQDAAYLNDAVDQCRWGNIGLCGHYLIRAIPGLWPLGKILGT